MIFESLGYPTSVKKIEVPRIEELLRMPFFNFVAADEVYKYGTDFHRHLLDSADLSGNKKHIMVQSVVQFLTPDISPVINVNANDMEWHIDGNMTMFEEGHMPDDYHLLISGYDLTSITDFNTVPIKFSIKEPSAGEVCRKLNTYIGEKLVAKPIEIGSLTKFNSFNVHRARNPEKAEFRYFFRISETNDDKDYFSYKYDPTNPFSKASRVYNGIGSPGKESILQDGKRLIINV